MASPDRPSGDRVYRPDALYWLTRVVSLPLAIGILVLVLIDQSSSWRSEPVWWFLAVLAGLITVLACRLPWVGIRTRGDELVLTNEFRSRRIDRSLVDSAHSQKIESPFFPRWELTFSIGDGSHVRFNPIVARLRPNNRLDAIVDDLNEWITTASATATQP